MDKRHRRQEGCKEHFILFRLENMNYGARTFFLMVCTFALWINLLTLVLPTLHHHFSLISTADRQLQFFLIALTKSFCFYTVFIRTCEYN